MRARPPRVVPSQTRSAARSQADGQSISPWVRGGRFWDAWKRAIAQATSPVPAAQSAPGRRGRGGVRLVRTPATLPRVLSPADAGALLDALRTRRDRAMVSAMLLGGLRLCEVLGLRLADVSVGERRLHVCGKGGRERIVPFSGRFFAALGEYLALERPGDAPTDACFLVLKGRRRGLALSPAGLDEVLDGARARAGLAKATCHRSEERRVGKE